jgi:hypothetical protein
LLTDACPECHVPKTISDAHEWLNNGDIVQRLNNAARLAFIESEHFDPLFKKIEGILGIGIRDMLINIGARANALYLAWLIPKEVRETVQSGQMEMGPFIQGITILAENAGFARYELLGWRYEKDEYDFCKHRVVNPYSLPLAAGSYVGAVAGVVGGEHKVSFKQISSDVYEFETAWDEYPIRLKKSLKIVPHKHREGNIYLQCCSTCGVPLAMSQNEWVPERGMIRNRRSGRRMVLLGPEMVDSIFRALVGHLGDTFESAVVEAERSVTRDTFSPLNIREDMKLREELAFKGLGNLAQFSLSPKKMYLALKNTCLHLILAGMFQGAFETTYDLDSNIEWEMTSENTLTLEVTPR